MPLKLFVTGTDTEVGKTHITAGLLNYFNQKGLSTLGLKPLASGCIEEEGQFLSSDAKTLQLHSSISLPYEQINPFAFAPAIAPHVAAGLVKETLSIKKMVARLQPALDCPADVFIMEGAGGWYCPINYQETLAGLAKALEFKVVLVVGLRLGCLNHALLTYQAILKEEVPLLGWIGNSIDPDMSYRDESVSTLQAMIKAPCLGVVGHGQMDMSGCFNL